jgi:calcineurin-like phosphoesterase family protein
MALLDFLSFDSWITSDHHWGHANIVHFQDRPARSEALMVKQWENLVGPDDVVLHLGDLVCFEHRHGKEKAASYKTLIAELPGLKFILLGNHDDHTHAWYEAAGFSVLGRGNKPYLWHRPDNGARIAFSHEPMPDGGWKINVHGHTHKHPHRPELGRGRDRRNVCVELTNYAPVRLRDVLDSLT